MSSDKLRSEAQRDALNKHLQELFGEPDEIRNVFCSQCGETYPVCEVRPNTFDGIPLCRNWPKCDGRGIGDMCDASSPYLGGPVD